VLTSTIAATSISVHLKSLNNTIRMSERVVGTTTTIPGEMPGYTRSASATTPEAAWLNSQIAAVTLVTVAVAIGVTVTTVALTPTASTTTTTAVAEAATEIRSKLAPLVHPPTILLTVRR
jgi:hypothetical protein